MNQGQVNIGMFAATAIVETGNIGRGTKIWNFTHIREGAEIGEDCTIGNNCYIDKSVIIGNRVKIQNGCNIFLGVELCNGVFIAPNVTFTNVKRPRSQYPVDEFQYLETCVGKGATIGAGSVIVCGNSIGKHAFVGAGSLVTKPVRPYNLVFGSPAQIQGVVCECGNQISDRSLAHSITRTCGCGKRYDIQSPGYNLNSPLDVTEIEPITIGEQA